MSQWGHDFRKEYLEIKSARDALGSPRVPIQALDEAKAMTHDSFA